MPGIELYVRVVRGQVADSEPLDVDPGALALYQIPLEPVTAPAAPLLAQTDASTAQAASSMVANAAAAAAAAVSSVKPAAVEDEKRPSDGLVDPVSLDDADMAPPAVAAPPNPSPAPPQPDDLATGVLIERLEHSSLNPYARLRVTVYNNMNVYTDPVTGGPFVFETAYAQTGASGRLGLTEWQQRYVFDRMPQFAKTRWVIELLELKDRPDKAVMDDLKRFEIPVAWTVVDAYSRDEHGDFGVNYGTHRLPLLGLPIALENSTVLEGSKPASGDPIVTLMVFDPANPPPVRVVDLYAKEDAAAMARLPFIPYAAGKPADVLFEKGDGFDVYVDGARFLPDNVTISKVVCQLVTSDGEIIAEDKKMCLTQGRVFSCTFNLRKEFRAEAFNPTAMLLLRIDTLDISEGTLKASIRVVGLAVLNCFVDKVSGKVPVDPTLQEYCLNEGLFQLPLLAELPSVQPYRVESYDKAKRVPCASVLVRIRRAPRSADKLRVLSTEQDPPPERDWERLGLVVPAPPYSAKVYDSTRATPLPTENKLYNKRIEREDINVTDMVSKILLPTESMDTLQNPGAMLAYMESRMVPPRMLPLKNMLWLDYKRFVTYQPDIGFKVAVDFANNVGVDDSLTLSLVSLTPPGSYYQEHRITEDVHFTNSFDPDSFVKHPRWLNGFYAFRDVDVNPMLCVIVDVRAIDQATLGSDKVTLKSVGWAVIPVFSGEGVVMAGHFQVPLIAGEFPTGLLPALATEPCAVVLKRELEKRKNPLELLQGASVYVRLVDDQVPELICNAMDMRALDLRYIPLDLRPDYKYDANEAGKASFFGLGSAPRKIRSLIPDGEAKDAGVAANAVSKFRRDLVKKVGIVTGIKYSV